MDWIVKNAINRDVEREHLNKILKEIRTTVDEVSASQSQNLSVQDIVGRMVSNNSEVGIDVTYNAVKKVLDFAVANFFIRLTGDVSGQAEVIGLNSVTIPVTISDDARGIPDAPTDGLAYWRRSGGWEYITDNIEQLALFQGPGFPAQDSDFLWNAREFEAATDELVVTNPAGDAGNVSYGLADVVPVSGGTIKTLTFDNKGRRIEEDEATTDDLPEGVTNLYFTDERAQDAVGGILQGVGGDVELHYADGTPLIFALLSPAVLADLALAESAVQSVVAGTNITVDNTDPQNPIVSATGGGGGGTVDTITAADSTVVVDSTDPANPTIRFTHLPTNTIVGRNDGGTGIAEALTPAEIRTMLNVADGSQPGTVTSINLTTSGPLVISGGPITTSGAIDVNFNTTTSRQALMSGGLGVQPSFRALELLDLPITLNDGTYTPTITNVTNVAASTSNGAQYMRVGNTVTVSGSVDIDPTATGSTTIRISLPIASNFAANHECSGTMSSGNGEVGPVLASIANDNAQVQFTATNTANHTFYYQFTYRII